MTSESRELSNEDGQPIALVQFVRGTQYWRYTNANRDIVHAGNTYTSTTLSRSAINQGPNIGRLALTITLPSDLPVSLNWRPYPPSDAIGVIVMGKHYGETDALVDWVGRVVNPEFDGGTLKLTCDPTSIAAKTSGSNGAFQRGCWKTLFSQGFGQCTVDPADHELPATLDTVSGLSLTSTSFLLLPSGRLAGGFIQWTRGDGIVETRSILSHVGSTIVIDYSAADLLAALAISAYPGCNQTWSDCEYFDNTDNFGGEEWMPLKDPFAGNPP